jgi:hypothetical protein
MYKSKKSSHVVTGIFPIIAVMFLLYQLSVDGNLKYFASTCVGFSFLPMMYVLWLEKK